MTIQVTQPPAPLIEIDNLTLMDYNGQKVLSKNGEMATCPFKGHTVIPQSKINLSPDGQQHLATMFFPCTLACAHFKLLTDGTNTLGVKTCGSGEKPFVLQGVQVKQAETGEEEPAAVKPKMTIL